jgi:hypothetical protein
VVAAEREHAKAAQQVEVAVAGGVEKIGALGAHVVSGAAEHAQDPHELRIEVILVQLHSVGVACLKQVCQI